MGKRREKLRVIAQRKAKRSAEECAKAKEERVENVNQYRGCVSLPLEVPRVSVKNITPKQFFDKYIATRTPVVFVDHLDDEEWKVNLSHWTHDYLRSQTPSSLTLKVEYRDDNKDKFGKGQETFLTFHEFLSRIESKDDSLYLTTQELENDSDGQPYILTAPLSYLSKDFPLTPKLFQNLVTANVNLWYGQSKTPSTSGLHHDFHDNLYVMLKGEKEITLLSPAFADQLYLEGKVAKIHPNGRFNYVDQLTEADGRDVHAEKALAAAQQLQSAAQRLEEGDDEAEDELDKALDAVLDAEFGEEDDFEGGDEDGDEDENEDEEQEEEEEGDAEEEEDDDDDNDNEEEEEEECPDFAFFMQQEMKGANFEHSDDDNENDDNGDAEVQCAKKRKILEQEPQSSAGLCVQGTKIVDTGRPKSFSKVDTSLSDAQLYEQFPEYMTVRPHARTVRLQAGEMLFIPTGWFHEVKSKGADGHIAFNYWFHPPDQRTFEQPYASDFWKKNFDSRRVHCAVQDAPEPTQKKETKHRNK